MSSELVYDGRPIAMHAQAVLDYVFGFGEWLDGETLASGGCSCIGYGCAAGLQALGTDTMKVRVSAVTGGCYVELAVESNSGQRDRFRVRFEPR